MSNQLSAFELSAKRFGKFDLYVTPANTLKGIKAEVQKIKKVLDSGLRWNDERIGTDFLRIHS